MATPARPAGVPGAGVGAGQLHARHHPRPCHTHTGLPPPHPPSILRECSGTCKPVMWIRNGLSRILIQVRIFGVPDPDPYHVIGWTQLSDISALLIFTVSKYVPVVRIWRRGVWFFLQNCTGNQINWTFSGNEERLKIDSRKKVFFTCCINCWANTWEETGRVENYGLWKKVPFL